MAEIIDALRRLERVGSDNSKATQKLLAAAQQLAGKIIDSYAPSGDEKIDVPGPAIWGEAGQETKPGFVYREVSTVDKTGKFYTRRFAVPKDQDFRYSIKLLRDEGTPGTYTALCTSQGKPVDESREAAFQFADDLVRGLLDVIVKDLTIRKDETERVTEILSQAHTDLSAKL
jgi:hypothetical protein